MSLILDALRGGRPRATPPPSSNAAQTDAVLHTLGYSRFRSTSPSNKIRRLVSYLAIGIILATAIWWAVVWGTQAYLRRKTSTDASGAHGSIPTAEPARRTGPPSLAGRSASSGM